MPTPSIETSTCPPRIIANDSAESKNDAVSYIQVTQRQKRTEYRGTRKQRGTLFPSIYDVPVQ